MRSLARTSTRACALLIASTTASLLGCATSLPRAECTDWRWVGKTEGKCGDAGAGWSANTLSAGYMNYCLYDWAGIGPPLVAALPQPPGSSNGSYYQWLEKDCHVVAAYGTDPWIWVDPTDPAGQRHLTMGPHRAQFFRAQAHPLPITPIAQTRPLVEVAVIDTAIDAGGCGPLGPSAHGRTVGAIIEDLTCPDVSDCAAEVQYFSALNLMKPNEPEQTNNGGMFGYPSSLARAIHDAIQTPGRRIINLSVGWDGSFSGHDGDGGACNPDAPGANPDCQYTRGVEAVKAMLQRAVCDGALVIAAAGNAGPGSGATGLAMPAGWESVNALSVGDCLKGGLLEPSSCVGDDCPRMVYAIGGIDSMHEKLATGREGGMPALAAPSQDAVVMDQVDQLLGFGARYCSKAAPFPSVGLSGTSAGTAVATAAAAAVWFRQPRFSAAMVMQSLYIGAPRLGFPSDTCAFGSACDPVAHRVSICGAVEASCGFPGSLDPSCPYTPCPVTRGERYVLDPAEAAATTVSPTAPALTAMPPVTPASPDVYISPYVTPMPMGDPCGDCLFALLSPPPGGPYPVEIAVTIGPTMRGITLTQPRVYVQDGTGATTTFGLSGGPWTAGDQLAAQLSLALPTVRSAVIQFVATSSSGTSTATGTMTITGPP